MLTTPQTTNTPAQSAFVSQDIERRNSIRGSYAKFSEREGVPELMARCMGDTSCTIEAANQKLLAHLGAGSSPISGNYIANGRDDARLEDFKAAAGDVLLARAGVKVPEMHPGARDIQRMGVVAMAEHILSMQGKSYSGYESLGNH